MYSKFSFKLHVESQDKQNASLGNTDNVSRNCNKQMDGNPLLKIKELSTQNHILKQSHQAMKILSIRARKKEHIVANE